MTAKEMVDKAAFDSHVEAIAKYLGYNPIDALEKVLDENYIMRKLLKGEDARFLPMTKEELRERCK